MVNIVIAVVAVIAAVGTSVVLNRRRRVDPPTQPTQYDVPQQLDRNDFARPECEWIVVVFTSATCDACHLVREKAKVVESEHVAVDIVEYGERGEVHRKYDIKAVPMVAIADGKGVVSAGFVGSVSATDLWAAVATARTSPH